MSFTPFLKQVASRFSKLPVDQLSDCCFVFPNNRSGEFFRKYLLEEFEWNDERGKILFQPSITTMSAMAEEWSRLIPGQPTELLLLLYKCYQEFTASKLREEGDVNPALQLDRFLYWGEVVLNDFDEIDSNLADASVVYRNLKQIKELVTNPLTSEQIEEVSKFWDATGVFMKEDDDDRMWVKIEEKGPAIKNFLKLWEILGCLYDSFNKALDERGLSYGGRTYRRALKRLEEMLASDRTLPYRKYVFIGFSILSKSQEEMFRLLSGNGEAEFYWDSCVPRLGEHVDFCLQLIEEYRRKFPSPEDFEPGCAGKPEINAISVPSDKAQMSLASDLLVKNSGLNSENALTRAIVMPDSSKCVSLLNSLVLPEDIPVNITMGYPLRKTPAAHIITRIVILNGNIREIEGETCYYRQNVIDLFSSPLLLDVYREECNRVIENCAATKYYHIARKDLMSWAPNLSFLFQEGIKDNDLDEVFSRLKTVLTGLKSIIGEGEANSLNRGFIEGYLSQVEEIQRYINLLGLKDKIFTGEYGIMHTVEKMLRRFSVNFTGNPVRGVQIMGVLETRALDFEQIIFTSMNERVFPRKLQRPSFIPQSLRGAYGLPLRKKEEIAMAYHFYRLIGRASKVYMLYNSSSGGLNSGEPTRYIYQIKHLFRYGDFHESSIGFEAFIREDQKITLEKTDEIMSQLEAYKYRKGEGVYKKLSASSIKTLLNCELEFYLSDVCGFSKEDDTDMNMSDSVYGLVIHEVMDDVYRSIGTITAGGRKITAEDLKRFLKTKELERMIVQSINKNYLKVEDQNHPLTGQSKIFGHLALKSIKKMLEAEQELLGDSYMIFKKSEERRLFGMRFGDQLYNFTYIIDRLDEMPDENGELFYRIVDYKTGNDQTSVASVEKLTDYESGVSHPKAIMQLMLYCNAFAQDENVPDKRIQPILYKFRDVAKGESIEPLTLGGGEILDYHGVPGVNDNLNAEFMSNVSDKIEEFFNQAVPIRQTTNENNCKYCKFKEICRRQ